MAIHGSDAGPCSDGAYLGPGSHSVNLRIKFTPCGVRVCVGVSVNVELLNLFIT